MLAVMMTTPAPVPMQIALLVFAVVGVVLTLHENGWLAYLRDRRVLALGVAVLVALVLTQTIHASYYYDTSFYCEWMGWIDWFTC